MFLLLLFSLGPLLAVLAYDTDDDVHHHSELSDCWFVATAAIVGMKIVSMVVLLMTVLVAVVLTVLIMSTMAVTIAVTTATINNDLKTITRLLRIQLFRLAL